MIAHQSVDLAISELRPILQADGADLEIVSIDEQPGEVVLRLRLDDLSCLECVMPPAFLAEVVTIAMGNHAPEVSNVVIDDPRDVES